MDWRYPYIVLIASIALLFAWSSSRPLLCDAPFVKADFIVSESYSCFEFWLNRYQQLISGALALAAAVLAVRPVWAQLRLTQLQSDVALSEQLGSKVQEIRKSRRDISTKIQKLRSALLSVLPDDESDGDINSQWANDMEQEAGSLVDDLVSRERRYELPLHVLPAYQILVKDLQNCSRELGKICIIDRLDQHDEDHPFSDEDWARMIAEGTSAAENIHLPIIALTKAMDEFNHAFEQSERMMLAKIAILENGVTG